ncbi:hypothetical protein DFP72DRAFT_915736 [Ephemerocybe angulata]|uniref:Uncharacterized protein n=1 Tax=Ephemerocybe angulata TaxID=980116 RepID=A0A8H6HLM0_9AGAR|nr:hypothetical protein DFP72DRAFT_915736 [Tulosesus angulatus]
MSDWGRNNNGNNHSHGRGNKKSKPHHNYSNLNPYAKINAKPEAKKQTEYHQEFRKGVTTPAPPPLQTTRDVGNVGASTSHRGAHGSNMGTSSANGGEYGSVKAEPVEMPKFDFRGPTPQVGSQALGVGNKKRKRDEEEGNMGRGPVAVKAEGHTGRNLPSSESSSGSSSVSSSSSEDNPLANALPGIVAANLARSHGELRTADSRQKGFVGSDSAEQQGHPTMQRDSGTLKTEPAVIDLSKEDTQTQGGSNTVEGNTEDRDQAFIDQVFLELSRAAEQGKAEDEARMNANVEAEGQGKLDTETNDQREAKINAVTPKTEAQVREEEPHSVGASTVQAEISFEILPFEEGHATPLANTDRDGDVKMSGASPSPELQYPATNIESPTAPTQAQEEPLFAAFNFENIPTHSVQVVCDLRAALRKKDGDLKAVEKSFEEMRCILRERNGRLNYLEQQLQLLPRYQERNDYLDSELQNLQREHNRALEYIHNVNHRLGDAERDLFDARKQAEEKGNRAAEVAASLKKTKKLLAARTEELNVAQAFMVTADKFSVADVSHMVEQLNDDVFQCAAMVTDAVSEQRAAMDGVKPDPEEDLEYVKEARKEVVKIWGEEIISRIQCDMEKDGDTFVLEAVVQSVLVLRLRDIIQKMHLGENGAVNEMLEQMWEGVKKSTEHAIAKNWFSMTHSQLKSQPVDNTNTLYCLACLTWVAGYRDHGELAGLLKEKVTEMTEKALKIKEIAAEGVLSAEVRVVAFDPHVKFDPERMQDAFAQELFGGSKGKGKGKDKKEEEETEPQAIVVSTGLGVSFSTKGKAEEVVMKTKVVLESALEEVAPEGTTPENLTGPPIPGIASPD